MAILHGTATYRRFVVDGDPTASPLWRDQLRERLRAMAASEPPPHSKVEKVGWCIFNDRLATDFSDFNRWLFEDHIVLGLRITKRKLPAAELKAEHARRCRDWCEERGVERVPRSVKKELKENLEEEWLAQTIPTSKVHEVVWNFREGVLHFDSLSGGACDTLRKVFFRTFGFSLQVESPLDWVQDTFLRERVLATIPVAVSGGAS